MSTTRKQQYNMKSESDKSHNSRRKSKGNRRDPVPCEGKAGKKWPKEEGYIKNQFKLVCTLENLLFEFWFLEI